jgi:Xaa-Pro aminopeptidase
VSERIERLRELLEEPLLITNPVNVLYLTGLDSSNAALLVEPDRVRLFTDFRYIESAQAVEGVEAVQTKRSLIAWLGENLSGRFGFEANILPWSFAEQLQTRAGSVPGEAGDAGPKTGGGLELVPRQGLVEQLRAVKDEGELESFRHACAITDRMFERLVSEVPFVGRRERDIAWEITRLYHEEGAEEPAFESIVGSGPTGARPHARAGDRVLGEGELVVIDTGCRVGGYASDYTRTLATGELDGEMREAYGVVLAAQQAGLEAIRAGATGLDVDAAARDVIEGSPFAGAFGHGLGHGLGLDVHESPRLSTESSDTLAAGNVVTVEPGVYLPGRFGIRIEDDVIVTDDGIENPVRFTKELLTVS